MEPNFILCVYNLTGSENNIKKMLGRKHWSIAQKNAFGGISNGSKQDFA